MEEKLPGKIDITLPSMLRRYHDAQRVKIEFVNRAWSLVLYSLFALLFSSKEDTDRSMTGLINFMMYSN